MGGVVGTHEGDVFGVGVRDTGVFAEEGGRRYGAPRALGNPAGLGRGLGQRGVAADTCGASAATEGGVASAGGGEEVLEGVQGTARGAALK